MQHPDTAQKKDRPQTNKAMGNAADRNPQGRQGQQGRQNQRPQANRPMNANKNSRQNTGMEQQKQENEENMGSGKRQDDN